MFFSSIFKALSDETRIRILVLLVQAPLCVCELETILKISQSNVSRHLTKLSTAQLIHSNRKGQYIYYSLNVPLFDEFPFLNSLMRSLHEHPQYIKDLNVLKEYNNSEANCKNLETNILDSYSDDLI